MLYPIQESMINELKTFKNKFRCADNPERDLELWGDFNSQKTQQLAIRFRRCTGKDYCKSEEEVRDWLRRKYIVILYNQVRFDTEQYFENSRVEESRIKYIQINSQVNELTPF